MSFNCLDPKTNIWGPHFLEASAGTGKTFAIEHVVARLLLESSSDDSCTLEDILVVTFTKAATRELKWRIRSNLENVLDQLQSLEIELEYLKAIKDRKKAIQSLQDALYNFDQAQIYTIHGFCHRMLLEFSIESGVQIENTDADQFQGKKIIKNTIQNFFRYQISEAKYSATQISVLLGRYKDFEKLSEAVFRKLSQDTKPHKTFEQLFSECELELKNAPPFLENDIQEDFYLLQPHYKKNRKWPEGALLEQLQIVPELIQNPTPQNFDRLLSTKLTLVDFFSEENKKLRAKIPAPSQQKAARFFGWVKESLYPLIREAACPKELFGRLLSDIQTEVKIALEKHRLLIPDELLEKMDESLKHPKFLTAVKQRFKAVIIDEFQDTDPVQWRIFEKLFSSEMSAIYLVGDPKQSIYAFRKADLYTYFKAADRIGKDNHNHLGTNYRSTPRLIEALNALFSRENVHPWFHLPKLNQQMDYRAVLAGKTEDSLEGCPVRFFMAEGESGRTKWPSVNLEQSVLFPFIASELLRLQSEGKSLKDCAVLVKDRFQAQALRLFLLKQNIASRLISRNSLGQSSMFFALQDLFQAVYRPRNKKYIKIVLTGPLFGWSLERLCKHSDQFPEFIYSQFYHLKKVLENEGLACFFREFLSSSWDESGKSISEQLLSKEDLSSYQSFTQLMEYLLEFEQEKSFSREHLFAQLKALKLSDPEENEQIKLRMDVDEDSLQILTIHMSKGLEFDVVFALGACCRSPDIDDLTELQIKEQGAEKLRQFYVVMTRARERLYVPLVSDLRKPKGLLAKASPVELFFSHLKQGEFSEEALQSLSQEVILDHLNVLEKKDLIQFVSCETRLEKAYSKGLEMPQLMKPHSFNFETKLGFIQSFTQLRQEHKAVKNHVALSMPNDISIHSLPAGAEIGVLLHTILEEILSFSGVEDRSIREVIDRNLTSELLRPWKEVLFQTIQKIISVPLNAPAAPFSIRDIDQGSIQTEMEFYMTMRADPSNRIKGFIDALFLYENRYYLIDWKSNWLGPSSSFYVQDELEKAMHEHDYFLQGSIYSEAIERFLSTVDSRSYEESFGGMFYVFLRGVDEPEHHGIFHFMPDQL